MTQKKHTIVGLGELLWDLLPAGKQLGGAPANFAYHAATLAGTALAVSRIGKDSLGEEIVRHLGNLALSTKYIQIDDTRPTGTVHVELGKNGQPDYTIVENVAWDFIHCNKHFEDLAQKTDAVCFGSLAQRSKQSRDSIRKFLSSISSGAVRIFDINLRQHYYTKEIIIESLNLCEIVKLNDEELGILAKLLDLSGNSMADKANCLMDKFGLKLVCITRGSNGCMLVGQKKIVEHPGFKVEVVDTVGSGDAFCACMTYLYLQQVDLETIARSANRLGSWVASQSGATPKPDENLIKEIKAL